MTTHLRARAAQAGALLAVVVGGIAVAPGVALASPPTVQITSLATEVLSGTTVTMQYQVADTNGNGNGQQTPADITVTGLPCTGDCGGTSPIDPGGEQFTAKLTAPQVAAGDAKQVQIEVTATVNGETGRATSTLTVKGPDKPKSVTQISGKVRDQDGNEISGASVAMRDSAGNAYSTTTNGSGGYSFQSSDSRPIVPGNISVGAAKNGFQQATVQIQAAAGRSVTVPLTLKKVAAPATASPTATVSPTVTTEPTEEFTDAAPTEETPTDGITQQTAAGDGSGSNSLLFILLGALLVAAGVGAIVLVLMRRKTTPDDDSSGFGAGGAVPGQGRFVDPTRVAAPVGVSHDATMVAPHSAGSPMADAPTMLHQPVPAEEEFPDPYGAPIPHQGGYAGSGGWDGQGGGYGGGTRQYGGYGEPTQYGASPNNGYGAYGSPAGGGYGAGDQQRRYDEPTGLYRPEPGQSDGYGDYGPAGGYGGGQYGSAGGGGYRGAADQSGGYPGGYQSGGYGEQSPAGDQGGYGSWSTAGGGIDSGNAYGPQSGGNYGTGSYGGSQHYGTGYDQGGYADQGAGGYGAQDNYGPQDGGYGQGAGGYGGYGDPSGGYTHQGGYDEAPGYGGQRPPQEPSHPGQRRSGEWRDH